MHLRMIMVSRYAAQQPFQGVCLNFLALVYQLQLGSFLPNQARLKVGTLNTAD